MDAPQTSVPTPEAPVGETKIISSTVNTSKKKLPAKKILMVLLALVLLAGAAYGGYWWRDRDAKKDSAAQDSEITALEKKVAGFEAANASTDEADNTETESTEAASVQPTAAQLENIKDAISSGNTAALEGRMADSVSVIIAASEGVGARTPAQAVGDIDYVIDSGATWDFNLSAATLDDYATGDYAQYFPDGVFVGKSSEDKVIAFIFDANAKIKTVFMSASADLL